MNIQTANPEGNGANLFKAARERLNLSQKELAERLHTSFYALVRWEKGDLEASPDVLARLQTLLDPTEPREKASEPYRRNVAFASTGARNRASNIPLFALGATRMLEEPRKTLLDELMQCDFWDDGNIALADILAGHVRQGGVISQMA